MRIAAIDIETTGLDRVKGQILQVGMCFIEGDKQVQRTYHTNLPESEILQAVVINRLNYGAITGLRDQDQMETQIFYDEFFVNDLAHWQHLVDSVDALLAHNAHFDTSWLKHHGLNLENKEIICTQKLMEKKFPKKGRWSLKKSFEHFYPNEYDENQAHSALYDASLCVKLYQSLIKE